MDLQHDDAVIVLALNVGSATLKAALFDVGPEGEPTEVNRTLIEDARSLDDHGVARAMAWVGSIGHRAPDAVGHRVVYGGARTGPAEVDDPLLAELGAAVPLAPLHLPPAIAAMAAARSAAPEVPHIACFDTSFHATMPRLGHDLALPRDLVDLGVRRRGYHGLNYEHVVHELGAAQLRRAVVAHLGSGCSLATLRDGASIDTTMGLTPSGGVPMATRSGDLDPGAILFLLRSGMDPAAIDVAIDHRSGLHAWSGGRTDVRELLAATDDDAAFAMEAFCYHVAKAIGALAACLGGLEALVFTGGIGEHSRDVRERVLRRVEHLGPFTTHVVPADEERTIARHTWRLALGPTTST